MGETPYFKAWGERRLVAAALVEPRPGRRSPSPGSPPDLRQVETAEELRWFRSNYLGAAFPAERLRDPDVSPLYADLHGLPPALFSVGARPATALDTPARPRP